VAFNFFLTWAVIEHPVSSKESVAEEKPIGSKPALGQGLCLQAAIRKAGKTAMKVVLDYLANR
jgi:hypothetical protein